MPQQSVFCIVTSREQGNTIVDQLKAALFSKDDISVLFPDHTTTFDSAHETNSKALEGAVTGASAGGVIGGACGWLTGIGALAIPGVGPLIAAGPIIAALSGIGIGATVGGIAGGLIGLGIPEIQAKRYECELEEGNLLLSVHTECAADIVRASEIFTKAGAIEICNTAAASALMPHQDSIDRERETRPTERMEINSVR